MMLELQALRTNFAHHQDAWFVTLFVGQASCISSSYVTVEIVAVFRQCCRCSRMKEANALQRLVVLSSNIRHVCVLVSFELKWLSGHALATTKHKAGRVRPKISIWWDVCDVYLPSAPAAELLCMRRVNVRDITLSGDTSWCASCSMKTASVSVNMSCARYVQMHFNLMPFNHPTLHANRLQHGPCFAVAMVCGYSYACYGCVGYHRESLRNCMYWPLNLYTDLRRVHQKNRSAG